MTFDLWLIPWGGGSWGAGTNMWHPYTPVSYESLPAPPATQIPTLWIHTSGGGGSDIRTMSTIRPICKCWCPPLPFSPWYSHCCWCPCSGWCPWWWWLGVNAVSWVPAVLARLLLLTSLLMLASVSLHACNENYTFGISNHGYSTITFFCYLTFGEILIGLANVRKYLIPIKVFIYRAIGYRTLRKTIGCPALLEFSVIKRESF